MKSAQYVDSESNQEEGSRVEADGKEACFGIESVDPNDENRRSPRPQHAFTDSLSSHQQFPSNFAMIFKNINFTMEFIDENLSIQYNMFKIASTSTVFLGTFATLILFSFVVYWILVLDDFFSTVSILLMSFSFIFSIFLLWVLVYLRFFLPLAYQQTTFRLVLTWLEGIIVFGMTITMGLVLIMRAVRPCTSPLFVHLWSCSPIAAKQSNYTGVPSRLM